MFSSKTMKDILLTPEKHKAQVAAYSAVIGDYKIFASVLHRILENACRPVLPGALIQAREKSLSGFAEKVARKPHENPVEEFTDLCAARVIVQTLGQVAAVCEFIEANFDVIQKDDKSLRLGDRVFGYRDIHFLVRLRPEVNRAFGISQREAEAMGRLQNRTAEIQVRTWLQHAWADTLHDRTYKTAIPISQELARTGSLLAAQMEEGDRGFEQLASEFDAIVENYTAFVPKAQVKREIGVQTLVFENEPDPERKPGLALNLARLYSLCGEHSRVVSLLEPYAALSGVHRAEVLLYLGAAVCQSHAAFPDRAEYQQGLDWLKESIAGCEVRTNPFVSNIRKRASIHARALATLGTALERVPTEEAQARDALQKAHEKEPGNPYYLASMLGLEMSLANNPSELTASLRPVIRVALKTCHAHARAAIELPNAYFAAGRLHFLLGETSAALEWYARGIHHALESDYGVSGDLLQLEENWLSRICWGNSQRDILDLMALARRPAQRCEPSHGALASPILIVAGGADSLDPSCAAVIRPMLLESLGAFSGTVISGGTTAGLPGCVGDIAEQLATKGKKRFSLWAYRPELLNQTAKPHPAYDETIVIGIAFSARQILRYWLDILDAGIRPQNVLLLGFGGGELSSLEYRIALSLGASVGLVAGTGGAVDALLGDPVWAVSNLTPLVADPMTLCAFTAPKAEAFEPGVLEGMDRAFHTRYVEGNTTALPDQMKPWDELPETFKRANLNEAACVVQILAGIGLLVHKAENPIHSATVPFAFTAGEVERMAEMEHGRWSVERLRDGWRHAKERDDAKKLHSCLVPWTELPERFREYDRDAVSAFPAILAEAGLEICRPL
jgi:ppGpp synthetase/RelA/SpoT-type nucleotidyltranferase